MTRDVELHDGRHVHIRMSLPSDREAYAEAVAALSERSRYLRFFSPMPRLPKSLLDRLICVDQVEHVVYIATDPDETIGLGAGRYVRQADGTAEMAFAVADAYQGTGLGHALVDAITEHAKQAGVAALTATTLAENTPAQGLLKRLGYRVTGYDGAEVHFRHELEHAPEMIDLADAPG